MNKNNKLLAWLAIGSVVFFVAKQKSTTEPVAAEQPPIVPEGTASGDPNATNIAARNVPEAPAIEPVDPVPHILPYDDIFNRPVKDYYGGNTPGVSEYMY